MRYFYATHYSHSSYVEVFVDAFVFCAYIISIIICVVAFSITLHAGNIVGTLDVEYPEETIWAENVAIEMERLNQVS